MTEIDYRILQGGQHVNSAELLYSAAACEIILKCLSYTKTPLVHIVLNISVITW